MVTDTKEAIIELIAENKIEFSSTHSKLCLPIIDRIFKKMSAGIKFVGIKVENGLICDGHHRYITSLLANYPLEQFSGSTTSATQEVQWESVIFENEDWDTQAKINMLNEQDAAYNNMPIEKIIELLIDVTQRFYYFGLNYLKLLTQLYLQQS